MMLRKGAPNLGITLGHHLPAAHPRCAQVYPGGFERALVNNPEENAPSSKIWKRKREGDGFAKKADELSRWKNQKG